MLVRAEPVPNVMLLSAVHPSNIYALIDSSFEPLANATLVSLEEPANAPCAIVETLAGIVRLVIEV